MSAELLQAAIGKWSLIFFGLFFLFVIFWVFRPGSKKVYQDTASIPFRHENKPIVNDEEKRQ